MEAKECIKESRRRQRSRWRDTRGAEGTAPQRRRA